MNFLEEVKRSLQYRREKAPPRDVPIEDFRRALGEFGIIAEYKRASPSGVIRTDLRPWQYFEELAPHVSAFSVLTEPFWFLGDYRFVPIAKRYKPVLAKDFILYKEQIDVAYGYGADSVLIISEFVDDVIELAEYAKRLNLTPLIEVGSLDAALKVIELGDYLLGINARDLKTLEVSFNKALEIAKAVANRAEFIIESGINKPEQVLAACNVGARGVLIGTALMRQPSLAAEIRAALKKCVT
ncbi:MAG: indole-3-glycerol-phosphate synthase [Thermoproteus sp.]